MQSTTPLLVIFLLTALLFLPQAGVHSATTVTVAGSVGTTNDAYHFPLKAGGIYVIPPTTSDPASTAAIFVTDIVFCVVRKIQGNSSIVVAGTGVWK